MKSSCISEQFDEACRSEEDIEKVKQAAIERKRKKEREKIDRKLPFKRSEAPVDEVNFYTIFTIV